MNDKMRLQGISNKLKSKFLLHNDKFIMYQTANYQPPLWARNTHVQSILATFKLRRVFVEKRAQPLLDVSEEIILDCGAGVRLQGFYSPHENKDAPLVVLFHGWEGSANSMYLLSAAQSLFAEGYSVFRLNLRDHGESHHLNEDLFHSCRLDEVVGAIKAIKARYSPVKFFMGGYSLGGNFCLRVAAVAHQHDIEIDKVVAICPPIDPIDTMAQIKNGFAAYNWYFLKKWRGSLRKKIELFPERYDEDKILEHKDLAKLTDVLLDEFCEFESAREYFDGYALKGERLKDLKTPAVMLLAKDDTIIQHKSSELVHKSEYLTIIKSEHGGHCGFLKDGRLNSWADEFLIQQFSSKHQES